MAQIQKLEQAGCEIIRCAVPTMEAAEAFAKIKKQIHIPLVADIHFDYRLAIAAIENEMNIRHQRNMDLLLDLGSPLRRLRTGQTRSVSILAISAAQKGSVPLWRRQRKLMCRSGWASTAGLWRSTW